MIQGKTAEETVRLTAEALGVSEAQARFILALETDEIDGDLAPLDDQGNIIREPPVASVLGEED